MNPFPNLELFLVNFHFKYKYNYKESLFDSYSLNEYLRSESPLESYNLAGKRQFCAWDIGGHWKM